MGFSPLFQIEADAESVVTQPNESQTRSAPRRVSESQVQSVTRRRSEKKQVDLRGCEHCSLNDVPGINKILGTITGQKVLVLAQSPGPEENAAGIELIGRSGKFFWGEMARAGFKRSDVDVQNSVRCFPADPVKGSYSSYLKMRNPSAEEIKCCSLHTENALAKSKAQHILVLGQVAAKALLKTRSIPSQKIFWSEELQAKIYLIDHPAFFIRGGITNETDSSKHPKLDAMRKTLVLLQHDVSNGSTNVSDPYSYLKEQKYYLVVTSKQALQAEGILNKYGAAGRRIAVDIENYVDEAGKTVVTCCGFSPKPGYAFVFMFEHKDLPINNGKAVRVVAERILKNSKIKKTFQWGCSDVLKLSEIGIEVEGFTFDTLYSEYFSQPDQKKYGLEEIVELRLPQFSGYKTIVYRDILENSNDVPESVLAASSKVQKAYIKKHRLFDIRKLSLETYRLYNGADADVTKRIELLNQKSGPTALMQLYIDLGYVLYQMEANGPLFDYEQNDKLRIIYPKREEKLLAELREMIGDPTYNPASPQQVSRALYETLKLTYPGEGKPNTRKEVLFVLALQHPFPAKQVEVRRTQKAKGTYIGGYRKCAEANRGRLRTKWKSTGTASGRLSSGGDKDDPGCINLQNIHGDLQMRNMLIADMHWREAYEAMGKLVKVKKYYAAIAALDGFISKLKKIKKYGDEQQKKLIEKASLKLKLKQLKKSAEEALEIWLTEEMPDLMTFFGLDYGQLEVRVAAQLSGDKNLIKDCMESDIHTKVGSVMTGWDPDMIRKDKKTRTLTKNIHFGIIFGQSEDATVNYIRAVTPLEDRDKITEEEIRQGYRRYHKRYPGVRLFIERQREIVREHGYVETLFGLRRPLVIPEDHSRNAEGAGEEEYLESENTRNSYWGNICVNSRVQGTAHQLMICALVNFWRQPEKYAVLGIPTLEVHDFLGFRLKVTDLLKAYKTAKYLLEQESLNTVKKDFPHIDWKVPIVSEAEAGIRFGCQVGLEDDFTIGSFLLDWFIKCDKQEKAIDLELESIATN